MIGVLCKEIEKEIVKEFFELFKTPWEFFSSNHPYDVVISTLGESTPTNARLVVFYSSEFCKYDELHGVTVQQAPDEHSIVCTHFCLPVYLQLANISGKGAPLMLDGSKSNAVALEISEPCRKTIRVGYDLFQEVAFLLTEGQSAENAQVPTIELHIALLREWMSNAGIAWVEIPPIPYQYQFFACLTHDVDFAGIRRHFFDHTMWGFVSRSLVGTTVSFLKGRATKAKLLKNWAAVIQLPLVFLKVKEDFWEHFDQYAKIDAGFGSTYFLIPFKNRAGDGKKGIGQQRRAVRYDILDVKTQVGCLLNLGAEIGLHGIDAWHSAEKGQQELDRIAKVTGQNEIGIRVHWLYYDHQSASLLEQAGFDYDATLGFNETVGFKNGTTQVFQPLKAAHLLEIPLNIQDTALFFPHRMALRDSEANQLCSKLFEAVQRYHGVLTLSWHERSLAPERLWGDFYVHLLQRLQSQHAWVGSARQVVSWFRQRRSIIFEESGIKGNQYLLKIKGDHSVTDPQMFFRLYTPQATEKFDRGIKQHCYDVPWNGVSSIEIPMNEESALW